MSSYGSNVLGGAGGENIVIRSRDSAELLSALQGTSPRIVTFDRVMAGGFIDSVNPFIVTGMENITIDGGGAWVWLRAPYNRFMSGNNIVVKNMRFCVDQSDRDNGDPLLVTDCTNIRFENCEFWHSNDDFTVQGCDNLGFYRCAWAEPVGDGSSPGAHAFGLFFATTNGGVSVTESMICHANLRNPLVNGGGPFHFINNLVIYVADGVNLSATHAPIEANIIGNQYGPRAASWGGQWFRDTASTYESTYYLEDNIDLMESSTNPDPVDEPLDPEHLPETIMPASEVYAHVLANVGAWVNGRRHPKMENLIKRIQRGDNNFKTEATWPREEIYLW